MAQLQIVAAPDEPFGSLLPTSFDNMRIPALKLHPIHGGSEQHRAVEALAEDVVASVAANSSCAEVQSDEDLSVGISGNHLDICSAAGPFRVPLVRAELRCGPLPRTLLVKSRASAAASSAGRRVSKPVPVEVIDGGSSTYLCRGCLRRGLRGFRCTLAGAPEDAECTVRRRPLEQQTFCPTCATQGAPLDTWLLEFDQSETEAIDDEMAMQLVLAALARAGASRTDLDPSFEIWQKELGRGSNAVVHRAQRRKPLQEGTEESLVVKFFNAGREENVEKDYRTILQEVLVLAAVQGHPNIMGFHGLFSAPAPENSQWPNSARHALMLDFYSGGDLWDAVKTGKTSEHQAAVVSRDLLSALAHVHAAGFVHRDVKLENIMLTSDHRAILADFGLACLSNDRAEMVRRCGSAGYCAPEIIEGVPYDETVDVFAAGVVVYAMLLSTLPFAGPDTETVFENTIRCKISFDAGGKESKDLSVRSKSFVRHLLRRRPEARPSCKTALRHAWLSPKEDPDTADDMARRTRDSQVSVTTTASTGPTMRETGASSSGADFSEGREICDFVQGDSVNSCLEGDVFSVVTAPTEPPPKKFGRYKGDLRQRFKASAAKRLPSALGSQVMNHAMGKTGVAELAGRAQTRGTDLVALVEEPEPAAIVDDKTGGQRLTAPEVFQPDACKFATEPVGEDFSSEYPGGVKFANIVPGSSSSSVAPSRPVHRRLRLAGQQNASERAEAGSDAAACSSNMVVTPPPDRPDTAAPAGMMMVAKPHRNPLRRFFRAK